MARFLKNRNEAVGKAPGSLIHIGKQKMDKSRIRIIKYNENEIIEKEIDDYNNLKKLADKNFTTWINIDGLHDVDLMKSVMDEFEIPPLAMEDIMNTDQRPKIIESKEHLIIILKVLYAEDNTGNLKTEQISFILGKDYILTIQERIGDYFEPVRDRIRNMSGKIRSRKSDYVQYALVDTIIDSYLHNIEKIGNKVESMDDVIIKSHSKQLAEILYLQKTEMNFVRKSVRPVKEIVLRMMKTESSLVEKETLHYWNDLEDLILQAIDAVEVYYTMTSDQINLYQTNISNRANDVMKVLTIFASIFIPLTFIAGIYGTNFDYVPELHYRYSYFIMWGVMILVTIGMLGYYKRNNWL
jgi:magnesium transporter